MLGKFIQQQRARRNMTQGYLASELGLSRPTYIQIEHGKRELTVTEAKKLAAIFDLALDDFLDGREQKNTVTLPDRVSEKQGSFQVRVTEKNLDKFKQVILYVLGKVGSKPNVGETVLHKLFYFIDFDYYEKFEENLMGATYIKNHHGPTSVELGAIMENMQKNGEIEAVKSSYFKYEQKKYLPRKRPDLSILSAREIQHIEDVLARLSDKNAKEMENYSHEDIPWKSTLDGQPLSYESVFYRDERYSVRNYDDEI
jgi:transcriptional regulator with XRE-family HTH domain